MKVSKDTRLREALSRNSVLRYTLPLATTGLAWAACFALKSILGDAAPYVTFPPAIAFSALYCGVGPSIPAMMLTLVGSAYWLLPPIHSFRAWSMVQLSSLAAFLLASALIVAIGEASRRQSEAARKARAALQDTIRQRTAELDTANRSLRELSARLLQLQDDERRHIARELHDSVGQLLVGLSINLSAVRADIDRLTKTAHTLSDSEALVQELSKEVRTISHLLHPPLLDEAGLSSALRWYIDGFSQRGNIKVDLEIPEEFPRLPQDLEIAVFRTVQECLTNIHRHSGSPTARVSISLSSTEVNVEVEDHGKGIAEEKRDEVEVGSRGTPGVGIRGMRERIHQLGGSLEISSDAGGTVVSAKLPVYASTVAGASSAAD